MTADLTDFCEEGRAPERQQAFRDAARKAVTWEQAHPESLESTLKWIAQLHELLGSPPPDRDPWRGDDFRL